MYATIKNSQIVLALLKAHNIKHIVTSPGATNIPIVQGVQSDPFFTCYSIVDERSAMYFAIGLYLELGVPIATTCTSAQATRNYIPGLTEAFYKHVPVLAITASKHPRYTYQEYMQAPDQTSLPKDAVKRSFALPYISNNIDELHCERMANEAILELTHRTPGPVQLNLPMIDSEIRNVRNAELPKVKTIRRYMEWEKEWDTPLTNKKIMIVVGEHRPFTERQIAVLDAFTESYNAFVYINHLSNYHGKYSVSANLALTAMSGEIFRKDYQPDILITIGGQTGDYPLFGRLAAGNKLDFEHWRISEDVKVVDTYDKLTKIFECPFERFFERLTENTRVEHSYYSVWNELKESVMTPENLPFSAPYLAQQLHKLIPAGSYLNLAILNSLRSWSWFPLDKSITCYSNVAAFGIDGCMSMLLGQSVATDRLCFLVIGDLAFFYDMNSLGIKHLKNNIRILLVNNGGGAEFKLSGDELCQKVDIDPYIAAFGHNRGGAKGWTESNGFKYLKASTKEEFLNQMDIFTGKGEQSVLFEIFTKPEDEHNAFQEIIRLNRKGSFIKQSARSILGEQGVKMLKRYM
jgi:2-succinyl-5-enolpyruvyl-6-hydroxy-3-cyclohexene-1-carboxylate synthase